MIDAGIILQAGELAPLDARFYALAAIAFVGLLTFFATGLIMFARGWESYEERYVEGAERTLESMFLTIPAQHVLYLRIFCLFVGFFTLYVATGLFLFSLLLALGLFFLPDIVLLLLKKRRLKKFNVQLLDALAIMSNALKSGFTLPKAFELIHQDCQNPMRQEFGIVIQELRLGADTEGALRSLLDRMPSNDLDLVITSIAIAQDVGGNLTEVLEKIAHVIRERMRIEGRIRSLTAQGKLQGYVVSALPVFLGFMLYLIDPSMMEPLLFDPIGWAILAVMVIFWTIGFVLIRKICAIDV